MGTEKSTFSVINSQTLFFWSNKGVALIIPSNHILLFLFSRQQDFARQDNKTKKSKPRKKHRENQTVKNVKIELNMEEYKRKSEIGLIKLMNYHDL